MYIDNIWIIAAVGWIIYLLWRVSSLTKSANEVSNAFNYYRKNKEALEHLLCYYIICLDEEIITKLPKKKRDEILNDQARTFRIDFYDYYAKPYPFSNGTIPLEDEPMSRLAKILDMPISAPNYDNYESIEETDRDIREAIDHSIEKRRNEE